MSLLAAMIQKKESIEKELLDRPGVTGVDVGYKYVNGQRTDELAIRVHVAKKKPVSGKDMIPKAFNGHKTDVLERTYVIQPLMKKIEDVTLLADTSHYNPLKGGVSIGPDRSIGGYVFAGTLGAIVKDNSTGNPLLLSNFHVMCVDSGWHVGDQMDQPSLIDTGTHSDGVGTLLRASLSSNVDGAVSTLSGRSYKCEIVDIGPVNGSAAAVLGTPVRKRGRTTLLTYGFVDGLSSSVKIDYGDGIGIKTLTNQIGIRPDTAHNPKFSDHGDSGSVVVDASGKVIGLLFAGSSDGHTIANPISSVLTELGISLCIGTPSKPIIKDIKDLKDHTKDHKEVMKDSKDMKDHIKDHKEFKEIEKPVKEIDKLTDKINEGKLGEVGPIIPTQPIQPKDIDQRLASLEYTVGQLSAFITSELRPDLTTSALSQEPDCGCQKSKLEKEASDAMQNKLNFDNKQSDR